jgi:hypothetical protein
VQVLVGVMVMGGSPGGWVFAIGKCSQIAKLLTSLQISTFHTTLPPKTNYE